MALVVGYLLDELAGCFDGDIGGPHVWYFLHVFRKNSTVLSFGFVSEYNITSAVLHGQSNVPSLGSIWVPWFALHGFFMNDDFCAVPVVFS
jgi:hypothetical protein